MSYRQKVTLGLVVLAAFIAGCVGVFFVFFEQVQYDVRVLPSGAARKNAYLATERLLNRVGYTAHTVAQAHKPPDGPRVVILADPNRDFSPEQVDQWARWVRVGGHLILAAPPDPDSKYAPLLGRLGFEYFEPIKDDAAAGHIYDIELGFADVLRWTAPGIDWIARDSHSAKDIAASCRYEAGRITVLASTRMLRNDTVGLGAHATLVRDMVALPAAGPPVVVDPPTTESSLLVDLPSIEPPPVATPTVEIVQFNQRQSWMVYVLRFTWPFVAVLLVVLVLAIQAGRKRFGPMIAARPTERRSRLEHIEAMGRFLWKHGATAALLESAQHALISRLERRHPAMDYADGAERDAIVAEALGITMAEAHALMRPPSGNKHADQFIAQIRTLERYRRDL